MTPSVKRWMCMVGAAAAAGGALTLPSAASAHPETRAPSRHVLLLSIDGLHQSDLDWYVAHHPGSPLATLVASGESFTNARTPFPSDSFPGLIAQVTGGTPKTTGIYYDDSWNNALLPAGTTSCTGVTPGAEVTYFEQADKNPKSLDAGAMLAGRPDSILNLTGHPETLIDTTQLPVDPASCQPVFPHSYLKVNTIFEVARSAGLGTAWADKHPAYEIIDGPSGTGVQDLFTPEINSQDPAQAPGQDWTKDNARTQVYDGYKVHAVVNEINGFDHSGKNAVGTPAIFGMNFQAISTAQKLPKSGGQPGGYLADGTTPGPVLSNALDFIDHSVGQFMDAIKANNLVDSTTIILSAKHGQSPMDGSSLTRIADGLIFDALNKAWNDAGNTGTLVNFSISDDGSLIWLSDHSEEATSFAKSFLLHHNGTDGTDIAGKPKSFTASGLKRIYAGEAAAEFMGVNQGDPRVPDLIGIAQHGVVFTGGKGKIAEHGGNDPQDRHVPIVVSGAGVHHGSSNQRVETTQIAPTIARLLGLDPQLLQAVRIEHTQSLSLSHESDD